MIQILMLILIIDYYRLLIYWFLMPFYMEMKANNEGKIAWNSHEAKKVYKRRGSLNRPWESYSWEFLFTLDLFLLIKYTYINKWYEYERAQRGYYTVARRYEFYFLVAKTYCFCHKEIKFISSSRRVMFFLL